MSGFTISPTVQNYHWGKPGKSSRVASLIDSVDPAKRYAEAWYGDHEKSPSLLNKSKKNLREVLSATPTELLGERLIKNFGSTLPFLFKVLSVDSPLSIQVHPSKEQAVKLNAKDPVNYPDTNHKPEVVIALTDFEVLSGFKSLGAMQETVGLFPEIGLLLGQNIMQELQGIFSGAVPLTKLSAIIERFYSTDTATLQRLVALTCDRLVRSTDMHPTQRFFVDLVSHGFEADPGVFVALFLEHRVLKPGEAMYTPARVLHAYLKGDAIECMANSDNVVRAGLTPKHQDVAALLDVVDWSGEEHPTYYPVASEGIQTIIPPTTEFMLEVFRNHSAAIGRTGELGSPELLVLLEGTAQTSHGEKMELGDGYFIPANSAGDTIIVDHALVVRVRVP